MDKEEIKEEAIKSFREMFVREDGLLDIGKYDESLVISFIVVSIEKAYEEGKKSNLKLENNTLTVEIPKEYTFIQIKKEYSIGDKYYVDLGLMAKKDICLIRQPHSPCDKCDKSDEN